MLEADRSPGGRSPFARIIQLLRDATIVLGVLILMLAALEMTLQLVSIGRGHSMAQRTAGPGWVRDQVSDPRYLWVLARNSEHTYTRSNPTRS